MAITSLEYAVFKTLAQRKLFPANPRVIELGHSNWYGDVPASGLMAGARDLGREAIANRIFDEMAKSTPDLYALSSLFLHTFLGPHDYRSIDPGEQGSTYKFDLNKPIPDGNDGIFWNDLTINIGTAEHVFNVAQFFQTAHDLTKIGGLMIHSAPFTGWPDHGFYSFHPTFFADLARANHYDLLSFTIGSIEPSWVAQISDLDALPKLFGRMPRHTHVNAVLRKTTAEPFVTPQQAAYSGALSQVRQRAWRECR